MHAAGQPGQPCACHGPVAAARTGTGPPARRLHPARWGRHSPGATLTACTLSQVHPARPCAAQVRPAAADLFPPRPAPPRLPAAPPCRAGTRRRGCPGTGPQAGALGPAPPARGGEGRVREEGGRSAVRCGAAEADWRCADLHAWVVSRGRRATNRRGGGYLVCKPCKDRCQVARGARGWLCIRSAACMHPHAHGPSHAMHGWPRARPLVHCTRAPTSTRFARWGWLYRGIRMSAGKSCRQEGRPSKGDWQLWMPPARPGLARPCQPTGSCRTSHATPPCPPPPTTLRHCRTCSRESMSS